MNFTALVQSEKDEGREEHIPTIMIDKGHREGADIVRVVVGHDVPHPNSAEHHIEWIELYGVKKDGGRVVNIGRAAWAPVYSNPNVRFQINQIQDFKAFHALTCCNVHGLWANSLEVKHATSGG